MKRFKPILGISLLIQSVTFLILSLINLEKKKSLAAVFGIFSALGGAAGTALLISDYKEKKNEEEFDAEDYYDEILDGFDDFDISEDEIDCSFVSDDSADDNAVEVTEE